ncbi:hypothetical protein ICN18_02525 [Polynucleobacter sp. Ross1-W9]|uniref:hypothetical protein n=1 Tax=Polynucleobacter parvulilacunae TaxID=1855631 RepID=UPI001C0E5CF6|nr:hypothetical protein [Polynucleobacter parvulilacunae]MBU3556503.1 hypothetical protein [Polynucleobacter parvulilacunae]
MNWNEYIDSNITKNEAFKNAMRKSKADLIRNQSHSPAFIKAVQLKDAYLKSEGYLANTFGLRTFLKNNLYPYPDMLSDSDLAELDDILTVFYVDPASYLPSYSDVFNVSIGDPYSQSEIVEQYLRKIDVEYELGFPEDLLFDEDASELRAIWENYLKDNQKVWIRDLDFSKQKQEILSYLGSFKEYNRFLQVAHEKMNEFLILWVSESIDRYRELHLLSKELTDEVLDEIDLLNVIKDRLPVLLGREFDFSQQYFVLHEKYLRLIFMIRGELLSSRRDHLKIRRWENYFPTLLLPKLLADNQVLTQVVSLVKELNDRDYWIATARLTDYLKQINFPPAKIKRF